MSESSSVKKYTILALATVGIIVVLVSLSSLFETNMAGYYQVKQAAVSGEMSIRSTPGVYWQGFGEIYTYQISDMNYFSKHDEDGGSGIEAAPIKVRFNDGGTAEISGSIKFKLSLKEGDSLALHRDFKGYHAVQQDLVRQVVTEALMQTATFMKAEESYSTRRSEFTALAERQVKEGIYETTSQEYKRKDAEGNEFIERIVNVKTDKDGKYVVRKPSPFQRYSIEILQFVIKDIDFDETIDKLIAKKKEAEQQKVVARANAERAKQDAITAAEQGKADVAKAKAAELVEKIKAVTVAEKNYEVAKFNRLKADEEAKARLIKGKADAEANRLLVSAGLTPLEKATIAKETSIGVAAELAKLKFPDNWVIAGGSSKTGEGPNPFTALGLNSFYDLTKKMSADGKSSSK